MQPLTKLLKNDAKFEWTSNQSNAIWVLKAAIAANPKLHPPNPDEPYELQTDASAFALGATLFQKDKRRKKLIIGAASRTLTETEQNYNLWDREFMGFVYGLTHWKHLLVGTCTPIQVFVDHANLTYYRHPQKIPQHVARYINELSIGL